MSNNGIEATGDKLSVFSYLSYFPCASFRALCVNIMNIDIKAIGIGLLLFFATGIMGLMGLALYSESAGIGLASAVLPYVGTELS